jgi:hypothetical protein
MKSEQRNMSMVLVKFTDGPMGGEEREVQNADVLNVEYPGYAPTEQVTDPEYGQCLTVQWTGEAANEAAYDNRPGMPDGDDSGRGHGRLHRPGSASATGAERREAKDHAKPQAQPEEKSQVKDRRDAKR